MRRAIAAVPLLLALAGLPCQSQAHSFFDSSCCGGRDCKLAPAHGVTWTPQGWAVEATSETVPFADPRIRYNPPDEPGVFICQIPGQPKLTCLYLPHPEI